MMQGPRSGPEKLSSAPRSTSSIINTEGLDDLSEEVFCSVTMKSENCPFGVAECKTVILTQAGF